MEWRVAIVIIPAYNNNIRVENQVIFDINVFINKVSSWYNLIYQHTTPHE